MAAVMQSVHSIAATTEETTAPEAKSRIFQTVAVETETKSAVTKMAVMDADTDTDMDTDTDTGTDPDQLIPPSIAITLRHIRLRAYPGI